MATAPAKGLCRAPVTTYSEESGAWPDVRFRLLLLGHHGQMRLSGATTGVKMLLTQKKIA